MGKHYRSKLNQIYGSGYLVRKFKKRKNKKNKRKRGKCGISPIIKAKAEEYQRNLSQNPTYAETLLLEELNRQDLKYSFQRIYFTQSSFYIVDFVLQMKNGKNLIIELDGSSHDGKSERDFYRTQYLINNKNAKVIRFKNEQVQDDMCGVIFAIKHYKPYTNKEFEVQKTMNLACMISKEPPPYKFRLAL